MEHKTEYSSELRPLTDAEGGGWLISTPDLPGCMSDGETQEKAVANGEDALAAWLWAATAASRGISWPE
jgi:antitoxin HicB